MQRTTLVLGGVAVLLFVGCAGPEPRDVSSLQSKISEAEAGDFGACIESMHQARIELEEAKRVLETATEGRVSDEEYEQGLTAADRALAERRQAEDACNRQMATLESNVTALENRVDTVAAGVGIVGGQLEELEATREILRGVTFETNSAELSPQAQTVLDVTANKLIRQPRKVEVGGYTSSTGRPEYNLQLSQKRAEAVRDYLVERGVNPENVTAKGYGMADPIASNETEEGRIANQRVELHYFSQ
jgi:outer membrane protein OmpA-like peptidoglycan-associated protein